jgi:hypothetical protein
MMDFLVTASSKFGSAFSTIGKAPERNLFDLLGEKVNG